METTRMVEAMKGRQRSFGRGLLLAIVTFGIYGIWWWYKAYKEVYNQERRTDHPVVLLVCGLIPLVGLVTALMYIHKVLGALNGAREQRGCPGSSASASLSCGA